MNLSLLRPVPPGVVTAIFPLDDAGAIAMISVSKTGGVKFAMTPLKVTLVAPVKWLPEIVTGVNAAPVVGRNEVMLGGRMTVKSLLLRPVPPGVVMPILPAVAPAGTVASISVSETKVNTAPAPLKVTAVAPVKPVPLMVTGVPTGPLAGLNEVMLGGMSKVTVKSLLLVSVPIGVVTLILPVVAPEGTVAVI